MFIFAHIFAGAILGLGLWHITNDRRAIMICIAGAVLPDLMDKPLAFLFPVVLGSGRTIFHSLGSAGIVVIIVFMFVQSIPRLTGLGLAGSMALHQVFDEMWSLPENWLYPFLGPFRGSMIPDYIGTYFWFEITNPSEWLFLIGTSIVLVKSYPEILRIPLPDISDQMKVRADAVVILMFAGSGLYLVGTGLWSPAGTIIAPLYNPVTTVMAGLIPLCGALMMIRKKNIMIQRIMR
jgi:LexA-binding, inner membrane-associated putative hydrolase